MSEEAIPSPLSQEDVAANAPERDLEKERDVKCMPIAQGVLEDMAENMMPLNGEGAGFQPLIMQILKRTLDADTNIQLENSYIFQLILGILAGMGTILQTVTVTPTDDARFGAIGKKMLAILAEAKLPMGTLTPDQALAAYAPVKEKFDVLFAEEKLSWLEVKYISESIFAAFQVVQKTFGESVEISVQRMEAKILRIPDMSDLSMKKLNETLQTPIEEIPL